MHQEEIHYAVTVSYECQRLNGKYIATVYYLLIIYYVWMFSTIICIKLSCKKCVSCQDISMIMALLFKA